MNPAGDAVPRRRSTDKWTDERLDDRFNSIDNQLRALTDIPNRVSKMEVRLDRVVSDVASIDLPGTVELIRDLIEKLDQRLDDDLNHLPDVFLTRDAAKSEYIPRTEHEKRWQVRMQLPMVALTFLQIIVAILIITHHS